ncbi:hypothetical protein [Aliirhizobium smilacinae]|uniref:Uncharacterized protein n=1 Tax=Aliirhizobium smilacinae TaxID=1395944 RepID=A0A5C4XA18_9HYPH|nr:hypothetical protein [Rhizobium smilacinae]TNM59651.1 hypothetical protein FHP24_27945 [Rhizobium smilacinae]
MDDEFWKTVRNRQRATYRSGKTGALNLALLFGTAAIALSLIVTPMLAERTDQKRLAHVQEDFDMLTTGSIKPAEAGAKHYTIRRSVLQDTPGSVCIVQGYGADGDC